MVIKLLHMGLRRIMVRLNDSFLSLISKKLKADVLAGLFVTHAHGLLLSLSRSVYQTYYESDELSNLSSSQISWIGSIQVFCVYFSSALTGRLFDDGLLRRM